MGAHREKEMYLTKVLRQNILRCMSDPVINIESRAGSIKVAIIEREKILVLVCQSLNRMRLAFGEVPDVASVQDIDLILAALINGGDEDLTLVDIAPFCLDHCISGV